MKSIFITATNTDVGKTYAAQKLLKYYTKKGYKVGYFKPFETGVIDKPLDGSKILNLLKELNPNFKVTIEDIVPYQFKLPAAPYVAKGNIDIDINFLIKKIKFLKTMCNLLIIEGAGGLLVPIKKNLFIIDLIKKFEAKAILIAPSKLGCINDILLSIEALKKRNIDFDLYLNFYQDKDTFDKVSKPFLEDYLGKLNFLHDLK